MSNPLIPSDLHGANFATDLVNSMLTEAIRLGASDIHLQPRCGTLEILFRIDGVLQPIGSIPQPLETDPVARLLVMANLPTYQSQKPLEGRLRETPGNIEMRLGTFPTVNGTRAVVRLMSRPDQLKNIRQLGLPDRVAGCLQDLIEHQDGAILLTGPAGSGKTTTLYACLREILGQTPRRSVVTLEDPVESILEGASQSLITNSADQGMSLASALRSVLRQDPEVLLVGEIRDAETASAALGASLTGHLVFSSLHAGDVATALRRLVELQLPTHLIRSGLRAICSQRLLRKLCEHCKQPDASDPVPDDAHQAAPSAGRPQSDDHAASQTAGPHGAGHHDAGHHDAGHHDAGHHDAGHHDAGNHDAGPSAPGKFRPTGCDACGQTGFSGRLVIAEIVRFDGEGKRTAEVMDLVAAGAHVGQLRGALAMDAGWVDLRTAGYLAVKQGVTTETEVLRVLGPQT
jgi:type II secretory ATPase GspE/PulE/Tfp pilus assembly ATPase PilB-like protein